MSTGHSGYDMQALFPHTVPADWVHSDSSAGPLCGGHTVCFWCDQHQVEHPAPQLWFCAGCCLSLRLNKLVPSTGETMHEHVLFTRGCSFDILLSSRHLLGTSAWLMWQKAHVVTALVRPGAAAVWFCAPCHHGYILITPGL